MRRVRSIFFLVTFLAGVWAILWLVVLEGRLLPTGSMAPTLLGRHYDVTCKGCGYTFAVGAREGASDNASVDARCPLCGSDNENVFRAADIKPGAHFVVSRLARTPERWDVVAFDYPLDPKRELLKRVLGLPGETISLDARGDLHVKAAGSSKWEIARKPAAVQEALWMPVYDMRFAPKAPAWTVDPASFADKAGAGMTWTEYSREIRDDYGYNPAGHASRGNNLVGDLRVRARVTPSAGCKAILLALVENGRPLVAELPVGTGPTALVCSHSIVARGYTPGLSPGKTAEVSLAYADEHATVTVNSATVLEWDDPQPFGLTESSTVRLGVRDGATRFEGVKIDRDIFWLSQGAYNPGAGEGVTIPADSYFVMGDNSPNSMDSRVWGFVPKGMIHGRLVHVFGQESR